MSEATVIGWAGIVVVAVTNFGFLMAWGGRITARLSGVEKLAEKLDAKIDRLSDRERGS